MTTYNKFQYSFFLEGKESPQIVVRGDNFEEFMLDVEQAKKAFVPVVEEKPVVAQPSDNSDEPFGTPINHCGIHNLEMKERINKKNNSKFYSHYVGVYPNGTYCSGK